jgi:tetratricopeptide (TPR) repeat protein
VLLRHGLIEGDAETGYSLVGAAREYVRQAYSVNNHNRSYIAQLLSELDEGDVAEDVFEQALIAGFPELTLEQRAEYISRLWKAGLMRGHWANWRVIFEDYLQRVENVDPDLRIAYGVCLRRLADWESAQQVFYNMSMECGQNGQFAEQAHALIEWSILYKYQGEYQRAQALIAQARRYAERVNDADLLQETTYREAWIQIEQGNGADANRLLATLPESPRSLISQSEAQLVLGNLSACRSLAERALILNTEDQATQASLHTIIGRSYQQQKNYEQAQVSFANAVTLLERIDDIFRLARAQTNLAAVSIFLRRYTEAGELLADAAHVQSLLGDKVGLSTTRHNQTILNTHIAR